MQVKLEVPELAPKTASPTGPNDMELTEQQREIIAGVRPFLWEQVWPGYLQRSLGAPVDPGLLREAFASFGGLVIPRKYGGMLKNSPDDPEGIDHVTAALLTEELALVTQCGLAVDVGASAFFGGGTLRLHGTPEQKEQYLRGIASGEMIFALALTESGSGSDAWGSMQTTCVRDGDDWVLNGEKHWSSNGEQATHVLVLAKHPEVDSNQMAMTMFIVDKRSPGFEATKVHKSFIRGANTATLHLDNVRVPHANIVGIPMLGGLIVLDTLGFGRLVVPAKSVGAMRAATDIAIEHAGTRRSWGKMIYKHSAVADMLGRSLERIVASRCMIRRAAEMMDRDYARQLSDMGGNLPPEISNAASLAKGFASDVVRLVVDDAIQIVASHSADASVPLLQLSADAKIDGIFEGTTQIQHRNTAKHAVEKGLV